MGDLHHMNDGAQLSIIEGPRIRVEDQFPIKIHGVQILWSREALVGPDFFPISSLFLSQNPPLLSVLPANGPLFAVLLLMRPLHFLSQLLCPPHPAERKGTCSLVALVSRHAGEEITGEYDLRNTTRPLAGEDRGEN